MDTEETRIFYTILIASAVLATLVGFFVANIIRHQRKKMALEKEKLVNEILLLENERGRIAADLHDELGSLISAIKLNLECLDAPGEEDAQILARTGGYIDTTMQKIREISNNLMPKSLQRKGLYPAIKEFADMINHSATVNVRYHGSDNLPSIESDKAIHLYRIVQEISNNAVKHASASKIDIGFSMVKNKLLLEIKDNGTGFDSTEAAKKQGHGLQNIMRRVDMLQGSVYLDSAPGKGTHYSIEIPL